MMRGKPMQNQADAKPLRRTLETLHLGHVVNAHLKHMLKLLGSWAWQTYQEESPCSTTNIQKRAVKQAQSIFDGLDHQFREVLGLRTYSPLNA